MLDDFVLITYHCPGAVDEWVKGSAEFDGPIKGTLMLWRDGKYKILYGYHSHGDRFMVHSEELKAAPLRFRAIPVGDLALPDRSMKESDDDQDQGSKMSEMDKTEEALIEAIRLVMERRLIETLQKLSTLDIHALIGITLILRELCKICDLELWRRHRKV